MERERGASGAQSLCLLFSNRLGRDPGTPAVRAGVRASLAGNVAAPPSLLKENLNQIKKIQRRANVSGQIIRSPKQTNSATKQRHKEGELARRRGSPASTCVPPPPPPFRVTQLVRPASAGTVRTVSLGNQLLTIQFTLGFNPLSGPHRKQRSQLEEPRLCSGLARMCVYLCVYI